MVNERELTYYAEPGRMTDLSGLSEAVDEMPSSVPELCAVVQGLVMHPFWTQAYGFTAPEERQAELQLRPAADIIGKALELDGAPLDVARPPELRVLGNCRDFSTVTTALLRHKGVPARARCGFGTYFEAGKYIDHWVVEWWDGSRWTMTDAQLDGIQRGALILDFDALDVPHDRFVDAGHGWQLYRDGKAAGDSFGLLDMWGPWFIEGNVARDAASLNKMEMLPWDGWGLDIPHDEAYMDRVAAITAAADFDAVRTLYQTDERVRVPDEITAFWPTETRVRL